MEKIVRCKVIVKANFFHSINLSVKIRELTSGCNYNNKIMKKKKQYNNMYKIALNVSFV
jgi:hypothetical protein